MLHLFLWSQQHLRVSAIDRQGCACQVESCPVTGLLVATCLVALWFRDFHYSTMTSTGIESKSSDSNGGHGACKIVVAMATCVVLGSVSYPLGIHAVDQLNLLNVTLKEQFLEISERIFLEQPETSNELITKVDQYDSSSERSEVASSLLFDDTNAEPIQQQTGNTSVNDLNGVMDSNESTSFNPNRTSEAKQNLAKVELDFGLHAAPRPYNNESESFNPNRTAEAQQTLAKVELDFGLQAAPGPSPSWLLQYDRLMAESGETQGGILLLQPVLLDRRRGFGDDKKKLRRPRWLRAILSTNQKHIRKFGHTMVVRYIPSLQISEKELLTCKRALNEDACLARAEREHFNWEKEAAMVQYLQSSRNFSHVFILDADAALVRSDHDTLKKMVGELSSTGKELLFADEDWLQYGKGRINGGVLFAQNTNFTRNFFQDILDAHLHTVITKTRLGMVRLMCGSNEQLCINGLRQQRFFHDNVLIASGTTYKRGVGSRAVTDHLKHVHLNDSDLEIQHFMGSSKGAAVSAICARAQELTGEGPGGYGCAP